MIELCCLGLPSIIITTRSTPYITSSSFFERRELEATAGMAIITNGLSKQNTV